MGSGLRRELHGEPVACTEPVEVNHQSNDKRMSWRGSLSAYLFAIRWRQGRAFACPETGVCFVVVKGQCEETGTQLLQTRNICQYGRNHLVVE